MKIKFMLSELSDMQRRRLKGLDGTIKYCLGELKRMDNIIEYGGADIDDSIDRAYKIYQNIKNSMEDNFRSIKK